MDIYIFLLPVIKHCFNVWERISAFCYSTLVSSPPGSRLAGIEHCDNAKPVTRGGVHSQEMPGTKVPLGWSQFFSSGIGMGLDSCYLV